MATGPQGEDCAARERVSGIDDGQDESTQRTDTGIAKSTSEQVTHTLQKRERDKEWTKIGAEW